MALEQFQKQSAGIDYVSVGVRGYPLISCIPISRVLPPILHLLLGLGNDIYANFKDFVNQRIERISTEELEARNMSFLSEIKYDDSVLAYEDSKHHIHDLV